MQKEFAAKEKLKIVTSLCEAKTAKEPGRTVFGEMLDRIKKGEAQGILAWHPDRLARNSIDGGRIIYLLDTGKLKDLKIHFTMVSLGLMAKCIMEAVSQ